MPTKAELEEALEEALEDMLKANEEFVAQLDEAKAKAGSQEELDELKAANDELTATNEGLRVQLQEAQAAGEGLVTELEEMQVVAEEKLPADCINCGQSHEKVETSVTEEDSVVYHCPVCGHDWTQEHEAAPFRAIRYKGA